MRKGKCKHFNGIQNKCCKKGVNYGELAGEPEFGMALRLPCLQVATSPRLNKEMKEVRKVDCEHYEEPTPEEIALEEAKVKTLLERMSKAYPIIGKVKTEHKGKDWKGIEPCPVCGGNLHLSHAAFNGHVWGRCETDGCLEWME